MWAIPVAGAMASHHIRIWSPGSCLLYIMITIFLCKLTDGEWQRIERLHIGHGFDSMAHAVEHDETLNKQKWPGFDWLQSPQEAFLALKD